MHSTGTDIYNQPVKTFFHGLAEKHPQINTVLQKGSKLYKNT